MSDMFKMAKGNTFAGQHKYSMEFIITRCTEAKKSWMYIRNCHWYLTQCRKRNASLPSSKAPGTINSCGLENESWIGSSGTQPLNIPNIRLTCIREKMLIC